MVSLKVPEKPSSGILIPLGLLGEDGYCFDFEEWDDEYLRDLLARFDEAHENASKVFA